MIFITIIGWLIVVWLIGSVLYSSQFHLINYLRQKQRIKAGEVGELYEKLHKELNWRSLIIAQVAKLAVVVALLFILL